MLGNPHRNILVGGIFYPSEKYEFVSWDGDIPKSYGKIKHDKKCSNHQPALWFKAPGFHMFSSTLTIYKLAV